MRIFELQKLGFNLLSPQGKRNFILVAIAQFLLALLDLLGILCVGAIGLLASSQLLGEVRSDSFFYSYTRMFLSRYSEDNQIVFLTLIALGLFVFKSMLSLLLSRRTWLFIAREQTQIAQQSLQELVACDFKIIRRIDSHRASNALVSGISAAVLNSLGHIVVIFVEAFLILCFISILFFINPTVAIFTIIYFVFLTFALNKVLSSRITKYNQDFNEAKIQAEKTVANVIKLFREIRTSNVADLFQRKGKVEMQMYSQSLGRDIWVQQIPKYALEIAVILGLLVMFFFLIFFSDGAETIQLVSIYFAGSIRLLPSILRMQNSIFSLRSFSPLASDFYNLKNSFKNTPLVDTQKVQRNIHCSQTDIQGIEFSGVSFRFDDELKDTIKDVNFVVNPTQKIVLVGKSGSGKTTLLDILLGLLTPSRGTVEINGVNVQDWIKDNPHGIAYVPQFTNFVVGSIAENIALEDPIDSNSLEKSIQQADLDALVSSLENQERTHIGDGELELSGGEKQRIGIARALYRNPRILVLDESTSALDSITEERILQNIFESSSIEVVLAVSHRLSTIEKFSRVLYIENGQLVGDGDLESLKSSIPSFDVLLSKFKIKSVHYLNE